jgi:hypothetical protein
MRLKIYILFVVLFGLNFTISGQDKKSSFILGIAPHYGFIIKHSAKLDGLTTSYPYGFEITANWQMMDEQSWQYCFCYPRTGVSFFYSNFKNRNVLGSSYALLPFVEPAINGERRLSGFFRFGMGPAYMDKVYDPVTNPENRFFSSHLSFLVHLALGMNLRINDHFNIRVLSDFNHISNGGIKNPNIGINYPTAAIGAEYNFNPLPYTERKKDKSIKLVHYKNRYDFSFFGTGKTAIKGHERYPVFGSAASVSRVVGRQQALSASFEFTADYADREEISKMVLNDNIKIRDYKYAAILAGHELILGKFNFYQQLGWYVYSPFKRKSRFYQRYGINYKINQILFAGINLKAHSEVADFLDFRTGISF